MLVNTAAANLELKHGRVSAALLATAGDELQKECAKIYPKGISKRQVAETTGHRLQCKKVYHITLEKYAGEDKKSIELIEVRNRIKYEHIVILLHKYKLTYKQIQPHIQCNY